MGKKKKRLLLPSDETFKVKHLKRAYRYRAARVAILDGLVPNWRKRTNRVSYVFDLVKMWRRRLSQLDNACWSPVNGGKGTLGYRNRMFMRNCPPFGIGLARLTRTCNRPIVCPSCFARRFVISPMVDMEKVLYGEDWWRKKATPRDDLNLFSFQARFFLHKVGRPWDMNDPSITDAIKRMLAERRQEINNLEGLVRAHVLYRFTPQKAGLYVYRSGVALFNKGGYYRRLKSSDYNIPKYTPVESFMDEEPNKKTLARRMGRVFRYPKRMLTCQAHAAARLLERVHGLKLKYTLGTPLISQ